MDESDDRVEELHERDERIIRWMRQSIRDYIENLPMWAEELDEEGKVVSKHPIRFEGTEFAVGTKRGGFAVSIYPVAYSRGDTEPR